MQFSLRTTSGFLILSLGLVVGCQDFPKRSKEETKPIVRATPNTPKPKPAPELDPILPVKYRNLEEKESLIPVPPETIIKTRESSPVPKWEESLTLAPVGATEERTNTEVAPEVHPSIRKLYRLAAGAYDKIDSFEARLNSREVVNNKNNPMEVLAFKFRKAPYSVHLKWIGEVGKGREIIFVEGRNDNKLQVLPARSDMPLGLAPMRQSLAMTDPMVLAQSRRSIREAGMHEAIRQLGILVDPETSAAQKHRVKYLGKVQRPEYPYPLEGIEITLLPREERLLPTGGKRMMYFDSLTESPSAHLPVLVVTLDSKEREVEYYCFDRFLMPLKLSDVDFDPNRLWKK